MKKYKKKLNTEAPKEEDMEEEKIDPHSIEVVVERIEGGLVASLRIEDEINYPLFKKGDFAILMASSKFGIRDFVLYQSHDAYFLRRIIKYKENDIYVAGDNEKEYHIIQREDIIGKCVSRERKTKRLSFSLTPKKRLYTFKKVNMAYFRLKNRVLNYEQEVNNTSFELATQSVAENKTLFENKTEIKYSIDLDTELKDFLNPDTLVQELRKGVTDSDTSDMEEQSDIEPEEQEEPMAELEETEMPNEPEEPQETEETSEEI